MAIDVMNTDPKARGSLYGLVAEFEDAEALMHAAIETRRAGYDKVRAYTPFHIEGLADVLENRINVLPWLVPLAIVFGGLFGYFLQFWTSTEIYELNIGGRPYVTWPAFMPITFELAILTTGLLAVGLFFVQNGLPLPYHPIFNAPNIKDASHSRFFLCIEVKDRKFDVDSTKAFLQDLGPVNVSEVES